VTSDDVAASSQLFDLAPIQEPGSAYTTCRNQKMSFPPELVEHICDIKQSAHAAIVKRQQDGMVLCRPDKQLRPSDWSVAQILSDRRQVSTEYGTI
jgi:hypothetical protein